MSHDSWLMAGLVAAGGVALTLALAACSSGGAGPAAVVGTTSTTSAAAEALAAAKEACLLGDTSSTKASFDLYRTALALRGESTAGLSDDAVLARWSQVATQLGRASDSLLRQAAIQNYGKARDAAAGAAALDPRWEQLHRGLSAYAAYHESEFARPTDAETKAWFEDIRLGCERARALSGPS